VASSRHLNPSPAPQTVGGDIVNMSNAQNAPDATRSVYDFHTHTFYSDGALSPMEQARRAVVNGYGVLGLTDHTGVGGVEQLLRALRADREVIEQHWPLQVIVGVELTHVPAEALADAARQARACGAEIVVVHGETPVEPVPEGTNHAAIACGLVDVLAHPGLLSDSDAALAARNDVYLELTSRRGHSLTNGHVARVALLAGARLIVNSDSHEPSDLLSAAFQERVARGAGLPADLLDAVLVEHPRQLLQRVLRIRRVAH
jgi:histidinol phosphatase-like PHP family hydrolase